MKRSLVLGFGLMLSACGGDDASNGSGSVGPIVAPTPAPSPSSTPTYQSAKDFSADRGGTGVGVKLERVHDSRSTEPYWQTTFIGTSLEQAGTGFTYVANTRSYNYYYGNESQQFDNTFDYPSANGAIGDWNYDASASSPFDEFKRLVISTSNSQYSFDYVGLVSWRSYDANAIVGTEIGVREVLRMSLYGAPTLGLDLPTTGVTNYRSDYGLLNLETGSYSYTMNWETREFSGAETVSCPDPDECPNGNLGELRLTGKLEGPDQIRGTLSGSSGFEGTFVGAFFGPQARELGIVAGATHATEDDRISYLFAKRTN